MSLSNMDTKKFQLNAKILLRPVWHADAPEILLGVDNSIIYAGKLFANTTFTVDQIMNAGQHEIWVEFINKQDGDTVGDLDKAVIIEQITFNNISDQKFIWAGSYRPDYPEPWASQQTNLLPVLDHQNYLGWNGKWTLTFDIPVFTWMHKTLDLGWIYD